jgi:hypothetical protein
MSVAVLPHVHSGAVIELVEVLFSELSEISPNRFVQQPILKLSLSIFLKQLNDVLIECVAIDIVRVELTRNEILPPARLNVELDQNLLRQRSVSHD